MYKLNRQQRLSYQLIHGSLDSLNKQFDDLTNASRVCAGLQGLREHALLNGAINSWGDVVKAIFLNVRDISNGMFQIILAAREHQTSVFSAQIMRSFYVSKRKRKRKLRQYWRMHAVLSEKNSKKYTMRPHLLN